MLSFLIIILAIILFVYASFQIWPNRALWFLLERRNRQHYRVHIDGAQYRLDGSAMIVAREPDVKMTSLLRRVTNLPVYWLNSTHSPSFLQQHLLHNAQIYFINAEQLAALKTPGIVLVSLRDYEQGLPVRLPLWLAYLAGETANSNTRMRWIARDLQLSIRRMAEREFSMDIALQRLSVYAWERYVDKLPSIVESWLDQAKALGNRLSVADSTGVKLSHHRLITAVMTMRAKLFNRLHDSYQVGVCLPSSVGGISTLLTLLSLGKVVVNLNYTASIPALKAAISEASLTKVITSRRFIENLRKKGFAIDEILSLVEPIYLEDIKASITQKELLKNYLMVKFAPIALLKATLVNPIAPNQVAFILFSSGSEGKPKGVELTHRNIVGNARQASEALEAGPNDVVLSVLPIFHAFGLTGTTLLPLIEGVSIVCHPDPTDTATVGDLAQYYKATILCGTSTFFRLYAKAKNISPEMFQTLRLVVAGAERLLPEVRVLFEEKFKKQIYEGYGTTELSPVVSVNRPNTAREIRNKIGTVGRPIAGCMVRVIDPDTNEDLAIGESGLVVVGGVNVMKGYLHDPDKTNEVLLYEHGIRWYKTGDKGRLDKEGFLTILDRYSRFAKLGGEMVSLGAIEQQITLLLNHPDLEILAVAVPDVKKGEMIVLLHTPAMNSDDIQVLVDHSAMHNLMKPAKYFQVEAIPKLGTGKTDFASAKRLALSLI